MMAVITYLILIALASIKTQAQTPECADCTASVQRSLVGFAQNAIYSMPIFGNDGISPLFNTFKISNYNKVLYRQSSACVTQTSSNCYSETVQFTFEKLIITASAKHKIIEFPETLTKEALFGLNPCNVSNGYNVEQLPGIVGGSNLPSQRCVDWAHIAAGPLGVMDLVNNNPTDLEVEFVWPKASVVIGFNYCVPIDYHGFQVTLFKFNTDNFKDIKTRCTDKTDSLYSGVCQCFYDEDFFRNFIIKYLLLTFPCRDYNFFVKKDFLKLVACKDNDVQKLLASLFK